jgi:hypothetical protein
MGQFGAELGELALGSVWTLLGTLGRCCTSLWREGGCWRPGVGSRVLAHPGWRAVALWGGQLGDFWQLSIGC